ncbi:hypothetical protein D3C87_1281570 [compost metagenome]
MVAREMALDALAQVNALADIERRVLVTIEQIDAGTIGHLVERGLGQAGRQARLLHQRLDGGFHQIHGIQTMQLLPELPEQFGVRQRAVTPLGRQAEAGDQRVQPMALHRREQRARQPHCTKDVGAEGDAGAPERILQEAVVEARVVGHEEAPLQPLRQRLGNRLERGLAAHHCFSNAGHALDERRDAGLRV